MNGTTRMKRGGMDRTGKRAKYKLRKRPVSNVWIPKKVGKGCDVQG